MSEKKITWTAKTRRGMKRLVKEGAAVLASFANLTKAEREEVENAKLWLAQETEGDE